MVEAEEKRPSKVHSGTSGKKQLTLQKDSNRELIYPSKTKVERQMQKQNIDTGCINKPN